LVQDGGAESGILIKGGEHLEQAHKVNAVIFDKTGTITSGKPSVTDIWTAEGVTKDELIEIASAIESQSEHPLGNAVVQYAKEQDVEVKKATNVKAVFGKGIEGEVEDRLIRIGNCRWFRENGIKNFSKMSYRDLNIRVKRLCLWGRMISFLEFWLFGYNQRRCLGNYWRTEEIGHRSMDDYG
jgi:cation transport ATPase